MYWLEVFFDLSNNCSLKGKFNSGIEGAVASTLNHDFNWLTGNNYRR